MAASDSGIGKDPETVDEQMATDEQVLQHLESEADRTEQVAEDQAPSRHELHQIILDQREQMQAMAERIEALEAQVDEVEYEATTVQEVAESLKQGKIGGEAGREFIQQFIEVPEHGTLLDARATKVFLRTIEENRVGTPVTSSDIVQWCNLGESSNPSVQAKRVMERIVENREDGFYLGEIELKKHRGKNAIWLGQ